MSFGGGSSSTTQSLPPWLEDAAKENLTRARMVADIGYVPQYGLDVAGFSPMQESAMQNTANAASAFGLQAPINAMAGMPQQQTNNLGFSGYSSGNLFDQYLANLANQRQGQYMAMNSLFVDPQTGSPSAVTLANQAAAVAADPTSTWSDYGALLSSGNSSSEMPVSRQDRYNQTRAFLDNFNSNGISRLSPVAHIMAPRAQSWVWNEQNEATQPQGFWDFVTRSDGDQVLGHLGQSGSLVTGTPSPAPVYNQQWVDNYTSSADSGRNWSPSGHESTSSSGDYSWSSGNSFGENTGGWGSGSDTSGFSSDPF